MSGQVRLERRHGVLVAAIDRPGKRNAADLEVYHALEDALSTEAAAYVITGCGGDFSAGDDLAMFDFHGEAEAEGFLAEVTRLFQVVECTPRPVVAAVDGYALGFGFELALVCDLAVATPRAVFGLPEVTHGAAPPNAMGRGCDVLGRGWVRYLAVSGRRWVTGVEAHRLGMVVELHPPETLEAAAVALAAEMAEVPGFLDAKRLLNRAGEDTYRLVPVALRGLMSEVVAARPGSGGDGK